MSYGWPAAKVVTIVQARLGSSRLPGKVLKSAGPGTILEYMMERLAEARRAGIVVVATTSLAEDDPIARLAESRGWNLYRGHPTDLLDRHYRAALAFGADLAVKIPSDCPLVDPFLVDAVIGLALTEPGALDYTSNLHPATFPDGNDVEVMTMNALAAAWREATKDFEREHTTPFLWERPERFRVRNVRSLQNRAFSHRWTLDYEEDLALIRGIVAGFGAGRAYGYEEICSFLERNSALAAVNENRRGVNWYRHHLDELKTVNETDTRCP
jgi:spore coat polysaccharide biosynthesis protein SpsF